MTYWWTSSGTDEDGKEKLHTGAPDLPPELTSIRVGIWRIIFERDIPAAGLQDKLLQWPWIDVLAQPFTVIPTLAQRFWQQVQKTHLPHLIMDVYALGPALFWVMILSYALTGVEDALLLWLSNRLFVLIELNIKNPSFDRSAIIWALVCRIGCVAIICSWRWFSSRCTPILKARVKLFFQERLMAAHLSQDLETSNKASSAIDVSPLNAWYALETLLGTLDVVFSTISQVALLIDITLGGGVIGASSSTQVGAGNVNGTTVPNGADNAAAVGMGNGIVVLAMCLTWPLVNSMLKRDLDGKMHVAHVDNPHYLRATTLYEIATSATYKRDIISGTLGDYITLEHTKVRESLGEITDDYPGIAYLVRSTPFPAVVLGVLDDIPLVYYAISSAMYREGGLSIAALAMLHQTLGITKNTLERILMEKRNFRENLRTVMTMYEGVAATQTKASKEKELEDVEKNASIRSRQDEATGEQHGGIGIELKNVTFTYPSAESDDTTSSRALSNVSFTLPPSSLVVIVGANGSGKSSLVNLLSCVYKPTSGTILFDGVNPHESGNDDKVEELQCATAVLTQDHSIFPAFQIWENIAVGDPEFCLSLSSLSPSEGKARLQDRVREAARLGGALDFIEKQDKGFDEVLRPAWTSYGTTFPMPDGPLKTYMDKLDSWRDVSGGEDQRLAAARTFMRLMNPKTRLAVVDEPTSAMVPLGEFELFEQLRAMRTGKTMVFVTHRFGHLTRYADVILCMKSGELVEIGTHQELMAKSGEYCKLYGIQASAFTDVSSLDEGRKYDEVSAPNDVKEAIGGCTL